jgi:hypothetical protein
MAFYLCASNWLHVFEDELKLLRKEFWILFAKRCEIVPQLRRRKKK